ncbi:DUF2512 family protein [Paenibacillus filicis]|uniref:DUF2512 family protein n=1 Tax=Paenibacillus gyeongsangnamensis TaxID=3388067 RepID=A0ABT4Q763_9BACL|nr:DUF2512 family protein [Paenibacillus filicis]MCZ8512718.1 DUF2512 family protein [Paenibacillus filicis]
MLSLISKWFLNGLVVVPFLAVFSEATWVQALLTSTAFSIAAYLIGDLWILKFTKNIAASVADVGLAYVFLYMVSSVFGWTLSNAEMITLSMVVGFEEYFFHSLVRTDRMTAADDRSKN